MKNITYSYTKLATDSSRTGETLEGDEMGAVFDIYRIQIHDEPVLDIAYAKWENNLRDVRCIQSEVNKRELQRLEDGLRLGIYEFGNDCYWLELSQARITKGGIKPWSKLFKATREQLNKAAGLDVSSELYRLGALEIGTKGNILEREKRKNYLCAIFPRENVDVCIASYIFTRILPMIREYKG